MSTPSQGSNQHVHGAQGALDPVCGMNVDPHKTAYHHSYGGKTYYFCSDGCRGKFAAAPDKYLGGKSAALPAQVPAGTIYTCPMHPEVRQVGPGSCPICGMALEPVLAAGETGPNAELVDMSRRLWIGLVLSVPVVALEMGGHLNRLHMLIGQSQSNWIQLVIASPVVWWAGWPFFCCTVID